MRSLKVAAVLALGLMLVPGSALAQSSRDKVVGSGRVAGLAGAADAFNVSAHSRADGTRAKGQMHHFRVDFTPGGRGKGKVVCMLVAGNEAAVVVEFKGRQPYGPDYPFGALYVQDNGGPGSATPDLALANGYAIADCAAVLANGPSQAQPLVQGNIKVRDAT
jgi:hypothetical protein